VLDIILFGLFVPEFITVRGAEHMP
jgi:hypothetical protein